MDILLIQIGMGFLAASFFSILSAALFLPNKAQKTKYPPASLRNWNIAWGSHSWVANGDLARFRKLRFSIRSAVVFALLAIVAMILAYVNIPKP